MPAGVAETSIEPMGVESIRERKKPKGSEFKSVHPVNETKLLKTYAGKRRVSVG